MHFCFHGIGAPGADVTAADEAYFISENFFLAVLDEIRDRPEVELSFDDGYASDIEIALPAITARGLHARFFPLAGRLGQRGYLSADAVRELASAGMTIGSHGMAHRSWRGMKTDVKREELVAARDILATAAGSAIDAAACPFGDYDRGVLRALRAHGYTAVFTSDRRRAVPGAWLQSRYSVRYDDTLPTVRVGVLADPSPAERARGVAAARLKAWR